MDFRILDVAAPRKPGDLRVILWPGRAPESMEATEREFLEKALETRRLDRRGGSVYPGHCCRGGILQGTLLLSLGEKEPPGFRDLREWMRTVARESARQRAKTVEILMPAEVCDPGALAAVAQGLLLGDYRFDRYKSHPDNQAPVRLEETKFLLETPVEGAAEAVHRGMVLAEAVNRARDLVNEPANRQTPGDLAGEALRMAREYPEIEARILEETQIRSLGMEAFLAVAGAARTEPRFVALRYRGRPDHDGVDLGIAGKGIIFDTGGLSLKSAGHMADMKSDMAGAAAGMACLEALARNRLRINVTFVSAVCENAVGGGNYRPGDIVGSMAGKTIHIGSTDAEGRLTLADALCYLDTREEVDRIVDIATLTGAAEVALGAERIACVCPDEGFWALAEEAAARSGEKIWRLPHDAEYRELYKHEEADLSNTGGRQAGAVSAGLFVGEFAGERPWLHLDIAGTAYRSKAGGGEPAGATGSGVLWLYGLAETLQAPEGS